MTEKTYKREVAGAMLVTYVGLLVYGMWFPEAAVAAENLKYPVFIFASGAFGIDAVFKQGR